MTTPSATLPPLHRRGIFAYVGSRTTKERNARGQGICVYKVDDTTGALDLMQVCGDLVNPSFLALNTDKTRLYAVHGDLEQISSFKVDTTTGQIERINTVNCGGKNPVHLALIVQQGKEYVLVSNHLSHNVSLIPIKADGSLGELKSQVIFKGDIGPHRKEQPFSKPHFNPILQSTDPNLSFAVVPDKGLDAVFALPIQNGELLERSMTRVASRSGAGPRNVVFHPNCDLMYVANELDSTLTTYSYAIDLEASSCHLTPLQIVLSTADTFTCNNTGSSIHISNDGRNVYASNRGEDSIGVFAVDAQTGYLNRIQTMPSGGKTPRFFTLSPSGRWLYALNEDSDTLVCFAVNADTGLLAATQEQTQCGSPVCMVFS